MMKRYNAFCTDLLDQLEELSPAMVVTLLGLVYLAVVVSGLLALFRAIL